MKDLESEDQRLRDARDPNVPLRPAPTAKERMHEKQRLIKEEEAEFVHRRMMRDHYRKMDERFGIQADEEEQQQRSEKKLRDPQQQSTTSAAAASSSATAASQEQEEVPTASTLTTTTTTRAAPPRPKNSEYSSGDHQLERWLTIFGNKTQVPMTGAHPAFRLPEDPALREEDDDAKDREFQQQHYPNQQQPRRVSSKSSGVQFFRAARKGETKEDPFIAAFAPKSTKSGKLAEEAARINNNSGSTTTSSSASAAAAPASHPFETAEQRMEQLRKQKAIEAADPLSIKIPSSSASASAQQQPEPKSLASNTNNDNNMSPDDAERPMMRLIKDAANNRDESAGDGTLPRFAAAGGGGGPSSGSSTVVGGKSLSEWRSNIKRIRARGESNLVTRIQGEIGFAHVLSQNVNNHADAEECLAIGEYVWAKIAEMNQGAGSDSGTHGIIINVCSAMTRAGRTLGRSDVIKTWNDRLDSSTRKLHDRIEFAGGAKDRTPQDLEPDKVGARKHRVSANSMWASLRNPMFDRPWAQKYVAPNPDKGPRWTTGSASGRSSMSGGDSSMSSGPDDPEKNGGKKGFLSAIFGN